jgi:uncharacterized membrane-anchored protein YitT (DUF2179 family)
MKATILQIIGLGAISFGLGMLLVPLGVVAFGVSSLVIGLAVERGQQ